MTNTNSASPVTEGAAPHDPYHEDEYVTVTDLKQMGYCPRIVYYRYCLPGLQTPSTFKMQMGSEANQRTEELEHRRSLRAYGLQTGERAYDVWLESPTLGLRGRLDMLIRTPDELIPVDYKHSTDIGQTRSRTARAQTRHNWQLQLTTYALLLEEPQAGLVGPLPPVRRGFLYYIPLRRAYPVDFTAELKAEVHSHLQQLREMIRREAMPDPPAARARCEACEFKRFCNDV